MSSFNRPGFNTTSVGTSRSFYFASSKGDIAIPSMVAQSDKFSSATSAQTIVIFETKKPCLWNEARDLIGNGSVVTMCKGPIPELDGNMYAMMRDALIKSTKWVHTPGVQSARTFFNTNNGATAVSDVPAVPDVVPPVVVPVVKREKKREREMDIVDDDDDKTLARLVLPVPLALSPAPVIPETQLDSADAWL